MDVHRLLVAAGSVLLAVQCLKFAGVLSAIRWIVAHGGDFIVELEKSPDDLSEARYWELLDRAGTRWWAASSGWAGHWGTTSRRSA